MSPRWLSVGVGALACTLLAGREARAQSQDLAAGRAAFDEAAFDVAADAMGRVLTSPSATPVQLADSYRYLATIDAAAGHTDAAERNAHAALALDPTAAPPAAASPTVVALFNRVRAARRGERVGVALSLPRPLQAGSVGRMRVTTVGVPAGFAARVAVRCEGGPGVPDDVRGAANGVVELSIERQPRGTVVECRVELSTATGVVLDRATDRVTVVDVLGGSAVGSGQGTVRRPGGRVDGWLVVGIVGGVVAAGLITWGAVALATQPPAWVNVGGVHVDRP